MRITAGGLALLADALLLSPFFLDEEPPGSQPMSATQFAGIWLNLPPPQVNREAPSGAVLEMIRPPAPNASTISAEATEDSLSSTREAENGPVDWHSQGSEIAARIGAQAHKPDTFNPPPTSLPVPCVPRKSSFEWNPEEKKAGLLPLPYVVLGRCVVGLGFIGCGLGQPPEANSHLFDDMKAGKTPESSVPEVHYCD